MILQIGRHHSWTQPTFAFWEIIILLVSRYSSFLLECRYSRNFIQSCPANCNWIALEKMWLATPTMFWQTIEKCDGCRTGDGREEKVCRLRWLWQYDWAIWATEVTLAISKLLTSHCTCHLLWKSPWECEKPDIHVFNAPSGELKFISFNLKVDIRA